MLMSVVKKITPY